MTTTTAATTAAEGDPPQLMRRPPEMMKKMKAKKRYDTWHIWPDVSAELLAWGKGGEKKNPILKRLLQEHYDLMQRVFPEKVPQAVRDFYASLDDEEKKQRQR